MPPVRQSKRAWCLAAASRSFGPYPSLDNLRASEHEKVGIGIIRKALEDPCRWIATNAGWEGSVVVDKIKHNKGAFGFNAAGEEFEDLMKAGHHGSHRGRSQCATERGIGGRAAPDHSVHNRREPGRKRDGCKLHAFGWDASTDDVMQFAA